MQPGRKYYLYSAHQWAEKVPLEQDQYVCIACGQYTSLSAMSEFEGTCTNLLAFTYEMLPFHLKQLFLEEEGVGA